MSELLKEMQPAAATVGCSTTAVSQEDEGNHHLLEEVTEGNWNTPQVEVSDIKVVTGEEDEDVLWCQRTKLYRWRDKEWKQRGIGEAKLLANRKTGRVRFLQRQEKTLKAIANHHVLQTDVFCKLTKNFGNDRIWTWSAVDYAEGAMNVEQFALKFATIQDATTFKDKFDEAAKLNNNVAGAKAPNATAETSKDEKGAAETAADNTVNTHETSENKTQPATSEKGQQEADQISENTKSDSKDEKTAA